MNLGLLQRLTTVPGIAGHERRVREVVRAEIAPLVDDVGTDRLGNLIAAKRGCGGPTVLIAAHMDEIGFLVRHVDPGGFLRLQPVGSFDPRVLLAQRVTVHTRSGFDVPGVIETTAEPLHFAPPNEARTPSMQDLFVDVGSAAAHIGIGDMVTLDRELVATGERITSRALDDRLGLYVMIEAMRQLTSPMSTVVAVATTQEEVGSRGAVVSGYAVDPEICLALDLTIANDIPGSPQERQVTRLGEGPAIKIFDTTQISNTGIVQHLRDIAEAHRIPYQLEVLNHGGTDASLIQRLRAGVAAATLSIPARYIHTVNETVAISDVDQAVRLLAAWLAEAHTRNYAASA